MISFNITFNQKGSITSLNPRIQKAAAMAQKEAVDSLKTAAAKFVNKEYWLSQHFVKQHIRTQPEGILVSSTRLPLDKYKLSPKHPPKRGRIKAAVKRAGGVKPLGPRAFINTGIHNKPFGRVGKARLPIELLVGPAVPQLVDNPQIVEQLQNKAHDVFYNRLAHHISRLGGSVS